VVNKNGDNFPRNIPRNFQSIFPILVDAAPRQVQALDPIEIPVVGDAPGLMPISERSLDAI
jgi:hypothetical protein